MADIARPAISFRDGKRFHQVPSGEIRSADIADLAAPHEAVERFERFFYRRRGIETVHVIDVDVVGAETAKAPLQGLHQVIAGLTSVLRAVAKAEGRLSGN